MILEHLFAGQPEWIEEKQAHTAIHKKPIESAEVNHLGLLVDDQADKRYHGGPDKALHQYAPINYEKLKAVFEAIAPTFVPGSVGENLSCMDMHDENVFIGDVYQIGQHVKIQVSEPRRPCWKIDYAYQHEGVCKYVHQHQLTGWYYRVLTEGVIHVGDIIQLIERDENALSIADVWRTKQRF